MSYLSKKVVSTVMYLNYSAKLDFALRCCSTSYITSRKYSNNNITNSYFHQNRNSPLKTSILNIHNLNFKPVQTTQQRNFTDYFDGRSFYKWLSDSTPVEYTQNFIVSIHDYSGLPWWGTIICTTVLLRSVITLPLAIYQNYILAKVENIALVDMPEIVKDVKREVAVLALQHNWSDLRARFAYKRMLKNRWNDLVIKDNCHPFKGTITMWFQLPMWIFFTTSIRNIAYMLPHRDTAAHLQYIQMSVGGFLWIPDLTVPDGTWFMPVLLGISNIAIVELQTLRRIRQAPKLQHYLTNVFRCVCLALIPISATVPSSVCLYWTTSSLIGLGQNLFLMSNRVRTFFKIPDTPTTLDNPYLQLLTDIKEKGRSVKAIFKKS